MNTITVPADKLKAFCRTVLAQSIPEQEAECVADNLIDADLIGVSSHGVTRLTDYLNRMEDGLVERKTDITLVKETPTTALYDAANGWGQAVSVKAMNTAIDKALQYGTSFVGVRNSNHFGTASYYSKMAAARGCIGIATTNASAVMVPFGAMEASLGTNPISIAVPTSNPDRPVMLDMATSNVARGKIILANKNGTSIPDDWAITVDGEPTTDPVKALEGFVLPFGGAKGSGLAIVVDILTGVLTGSLFGKDVPRMYEDNAPQRIGHFFGAINIEAFMDQAEFFDRMQERIDQTVQSKPVKGFSRVFMPGEIELGRREKQLQEGVAISQEVFEELTRTGTKYGIKMEDFIPKAD